MRPVRRFLLITILLVSASSFSSAQRADLLDMFPHVDSLIRYPRLERLLTIICQKDVDGKYVTFVGLKGSDRVLLAAITLEPITDVAKSIFLFARFEGVKPSVGKVSTWGYVLDRNHDGKIDYMALLAGAGPIEEDDFPDNFPKRGTPLSRGNLEFYVGHCSLFFDHWADDNFDGNLDAVIHHDMDPDRDWVHRQIVIRSTKFDGRFDTVWSFRRTPGDLEDNSVGYTRKWVPYYPVGSTKPSEITRKTFLEQTELLRLLNRAAKVCGLTARNFDPARPED